MRTKSKATPLKEVDYKDILVKAGYKQFKCGIYPDRECWQTRRNFLPLCYCNDKSFINLYIHRLDNLKYVSVELEITAETYDGKWVELKFYSLEIDDIIYNLPNLEERLIRAWRAVNNLKINGSSADELDFIEDK